MSASNLVVVFLSVVEHIQMNVIKCEINGMIFDGLLLHNDYRSTLTAQPFFPTLFELDRIIVGVFVLRRDEIR